MTSSGGHRDDDSRVVNRLKNSDPETFEQYVLAHLSRKLDLNGWSFNALTDPAAAAADTGSSATSKWSKSALSKKIFGKHKGLFHFGVYFAVFDVISNGWSRRLTSHSATSNTRIDSCAASYVSKEWSHRLMCGVR